MSQLSNEDVLHKLREFKKNHGDDYSKYDLEFLNSHSSNINVCLFKIHLLKLILGTDNYQFFVDNYNCFNDLFAGIIGDKRAIWNKFYDHYILNKKPLYPHRYINKFNDTHLITEAVLKKNSCLEVCFNRFNISVPFGNQYDEFNKVYYLSHNIDDFNCLPIKSSIFIDAEYYEDIVNYISKK